MTWIVKAKDKDGFDYLAAEGPGSCWSQEQRDAKRFKSQRKALLAAAQAVLDSPPDEKISVVRLRDKNTAEAALRDENERLRNWVLRLAQMPLDWTSQETQRRAKKFWLQLENGPTQSNSEEQGR